MLSNHIIGRNNEVETVQKVLKNFSNKNTSLLLVEGAAGMGKTSLVQYATSAFCSENCFTVYGKFRYSNEKVPYQALKQALKDWTNQILVLQEDKLNQVRENAVSALQNNIKIVTSVFDELEIFFGRKNLKLGEPINSELHQIRSKFYYFFTKFLKSITQLGYKFIIYLDDLQWADNATLMLIQDLMQNNQVPNLTFIGAFRTIENRQDFKITVLDFVGKYDNRCHLFKLSPLRFQSLKEFIPKYWNFDQDDETAFIKYMWLESEGVPFIINEIIKSVEKEQLIEKKAKGDDLFWNNLPKFKGEKSSEDFLRAQLEKLNIKRIELISSASCIGYYFKSDSLKEITSLSEEEVQNELQALLEDHYIAKKGQTYFFVHDNVFAAANSLLADEQKTKIHYHLGLRLLQNLPNFEHHDFFKLVNHLNIAFDLGIEEKYSELILYNIHAAQLAIRNSAFERASKYFYHAEKLFSQIESEELELKNEKLKLIYNLNVLSRSELQYLINFGLAEAMFMMQNFRQALQYSNEVIKLPVTRHQKIRATLIKVRICSALIYQKDSQNMLLDGLKSVESVLDDFGIRIPNEEGILMDEVERDCQLIAQMASDYHEDTDFKSLINHDEEYHDLMKMIVTALTFIYYIDVKKNLYLVLKILLLCVRNGLAPISPVLFAVAFVIARHGSTFLQIGYFFGKLSIKMIEQAPFNSYKHVVYYVATLNFYAWDNHYKECINKLSLAVNHAKEMGDHHYVSFCSTIIRLLNIYRGKNLKKHVRFTKQMEKNNRHIFFISSSDSDFSNYLIGTKKGFVEGEIHFSDDLHKEAEYSDSAKYHLYHAKEKLEFLTGNLNEAYRSTMILENLKNVYSGFQIELEHYFYYCLILLEKAYDNPDQLRTVLEEVEPKLTEFLRLSTYGSGNYLHKVYLIKAEIAKCNNDFEEATLYFDKAIVEAREQKFINNAAIAAELAGIYYLQKNRIKFGKSYLKRAIKYYKKWGADAKIEWLINRFPFLKDSKPQKLTSFEKQDLPLIYSIIKNISIRTWELDILAIQVLSNLMEYGNAETGAVLVQRKKSWQILATQGSIKSVANKELIQVNGELPVKILNYAIHTAEPINLDEPSSFAIFNGDPYLKKNSVRNINCYPVAFGSEIMGLIYLENLKTPKELFQLLIEHATIALANAIYYENVNQLNKELQQHEQKKIEAIIESQEKERKRIAEELHDSLGQMLALTRMNLSRMDLPESLIGKENQSILRQIVNLLDESCDEVRAISHNLMPPNFNDKSLNSIVENLVKKNSAANGFTYRFQSYNVSEQLSEAFKLTLYRIIQEILHNINKHASAKHVSVNITQTEDGINLLVEDDGKGFEKDLVEMGLGLKNIHSRVKLLNGYFDIDSTLNRGTIFNITIPLKS